MARRFSYHPIKLTSQTKNALSGTRAKFLENRNDRCLYNSSDFTMAKINPETIIAGTSLNISDLLSHSRYYIPDYQRDFVWSSDEILQLWNDLTQHYRVNSSGDELITSPKAYFLGAMVVLETNRSGSATLEVIDGQQRLIALYCIAAVIANLALTETLSGPAAQLSAMVGAYSSSGWATRVELFDQQLGTFLRVSLLE